MLKYSTLVVAEKDWDENENLISTGKKFIDFQSFEYSGLSECIPGQNEKETINKNFKEMIAFYMGSGMIIPVPHGGTELPPGYVYHEVDWQDELRIRLYNAILEMDLNQIALDLKRYTDSIRDLFDFDKVLDVDLCVKIIQRYKLPIKWKTVEIEIISD